MNSMNVTLGRFNDSMNFIFGLNYLPQGFDILNNPYVEFIGYEASGDLNTTFNIAERYEFVLC